jgi:branched-chain amino acid transport system ATP-binding protein
MMVELKKIEAGYGELRIIFDVSLEIEQNEIVALVGANGAGKSTLIKTICGLLPVKSGTITIEGRRIENTRPHTIIHHGVSLVPEGRRLFAYMSVLENLEMGAYVENDKDKVKKNLDWVMGLFPRLKERQHQLAGTFSGGEQQMLTIARALMSAPRFLILDEPSLGLAPVIVDDVFRIVERLHQEGVTILLVEQNVKKSLEIADRAYVLEHGRIALSGGGDELLNRDEVKKAYLGM